MSAKELVEVKDHAPGSYPVFAIVMPSMSGKTTLATGREGVGAFPSLGTDVDALIHPSYWVGGLLERKRALDDPSLWEEIDEGFVITIKDGIKRVGSRPVIFMHGIDHALALGIQLENIIAMVPSPEFASRMRDARGESKDAIAISKLNAATVKSYSESMGVRCWTFDSASQQIRIATCFAAMHDPSVERRMSPAFAPRILGGSRGALRVQEKLRLIDIFGTSLVFYVDGSTPETMAATTGQSVHASTGTFLGKNFDQREHRNLVATSDDGKYILVNNDVQQMESFQKHLISILPDVSAGGQ